MTIEHKPEDQGKYPNDLVAYLVVVGRQGLIWFPLVVDVAETTWPEFCRQN